MSYRKKPRSVRSFNDFTYVPSYQGRRQHTSHTRSHHKLVLFMAACLIMILGTHIAWNRHVAAHDLAMQQEIAQANAARSAHLAALSSQINQIIATHPQITFSVSVNEIDSAHTTALLQFGVTDDFDAASTAKLLTAVDYLHHVEAGDAKLTQTINGESAEQWLRAMVVNSDDTAWETLNTYLTHNDLANYANDIGLSNYNVQDNELTGSDISLLLQKLYAKKLLTSADTTLLLSYMKQANYRGYIVPAVPSGYTVYHKVGIDNDDVHDAAIISNGSRAIELVIYTNGNDTYDWATRAQIMQQITKDVLQAYFG